MGGPTRFTLVSLICLVIVASSSPALANGLQDSVGVVDQTTGVWYLRDPSDGQTTTFYYGNPGDYPFMGDWDCDGVDTPGLFRQSDAFAYLRNSNTQGIADIRFFFGNPSDVPLAGDFNGDGCDTVSIYRPSEQRFYIINHLGANNGGLGAADYSFLFGNPGDKPVVGDWDGDGIDEVGLHRESTGFFYYRNTLTTGIADNQFFFGDPGDRFVSGDWGIIDGVDTPAVLRPSNGTFYFRHTLTQGNADSQFAYGNSNTLPVAGSFGVLPGGGTPPPPNVVSFGPGVWRVGVDIPAGTYRNVGYSAGCYWERLSGFSGDFADLIANNFTNVRQIVTIAPTDAGFSADSDCGTWSNNLTPSKAPAASFSGGTWQVPSEVAPGLWQNTPAAASCYWERLSGFSGEFSDLIANDFIGDMSPTLVQIQPTDIGFSTDEDCGTWTYLGP